MEIIGYVENEFTEPIFNEKMYETTSKIVIYKKYIEALKGLEEFNRIQILFNFNKSENYEMIQRRRVDGKMVGVFATRSPKRPNFIGITTVTLEKIEGNIIYVKGLDALNGSPVLDIKPYSEKYEEIKK